MKEIETLQNIDKKLSALIALTSLLVQAKPGANSHPKLEVILSNVGLQNAEIAKILGKKLVAVQKTLQRARK